MNTLHRRLFGLALVLVFTLVAAPALAEKKFLGSDDDKEKDEPQKWLKDYDKLTKGKEANWVYFTETNFKKYKTVSVKEFDTNGRGREVRDAVSDGRDYMEKGLEKQGWEVVKSGGDMAIEGNVFSAWQGGWGVFNGVGVELMLKDSKGDLIGQIRHKSKGSSIRNAVDNALEECAKTIAAGR